MKTILIVDDSATIRAQLRELLCSNGYNIVEAENGQEGLKRATEHKADLVICDVNMPEMDGITMTRQLRATPNYEKTSIFILTTESMGRVNEGKAAGATAWIVKPFKPESLLAAIEKGLARGR